MCTLVKYIWWVAEFKIDENLKTCFAQIFADMVRVGTSLVYDTLIRAVVDKIMVFGLLTNYEMGLAYPMKYDVDFTKDQNAPFTGIVHIMNNY